MVSKKEKHTLLYAVGAIIIVALVANEMGFLTQYGYPPMFDLNRRTSTAPPSNLGADYSQGVGVYEWKCGAFDTANFATSRALTSSADVLVYPYHYVSGQWTMDTNNVYIDTNTNYFTAKASDNGYAWLVVQVQSGKNYYVDYQKMKQSDSYIVGYQYLDIFGDGNYEFVFQIDLKGYSVPNSGFPLLSFSVYLLTYDASFANASFNTIVNTTGIGTAANVTYYTRYAAMSASLKGIAIYKVELQFGNSTDADTDQTKITFDNMQIPGIGTLSRGQFYETSSPGVDILYTYNIATTLNGADYIYLTSNGPNEFHFDLKLTYTMATSDKIPIILRVYYLIPPTGTGTSASCSFYAKE